MNYNLKGTGIEVNAEIRGYLEKRLKHVEKFIRDPELARADIELHYMPSEQKMYRAEFMLHSPHLPTPLRVEEKGGTLHEAIDKAAAELERVSTRVKRRRLDFVRRGAKKLKDLMWRGEKAN